MAGVTAKQLKYIEALAHEAGVGGDGWDNFPGMSRSKAQRKATSSDASEAIDRLKALIARNARRAGMAEGSEDEDAVLIAGVWVAWSDAAMVVWHENRTALVGRGAELTALREQLKEAGDPTPWATAMRQLAGRSELDELRDKRAKLAAELATLDEQIARRYWGDA